MKKMTLEHHMQPRGVTKRRDQGHRRQDVISHDASKPSHKNLGTSSPVSNSKALHYIIHVPKEQRRYPLLAIRENQMISILAKTKTPLYKPLHLTFSNQNESQNILRNPCTTPRLHSAALSDPFHLNLPPASPPPPGRCRNDSDRQIRRLQWRWQWSRRNERSRGHSR